jgi:hypothetical protein
MAASTSSHTVVLVMRAFRYDAVPRARAPWRRVLHLSVSLPTPRTQTGDLSEACLLAI